MIAARAPSRYWLTIVGEAWEGWDLPRRLIANSPHKERISFVNRHVTNAEVAGYFAGADLVVLPYHRSSSSWPLQIVIAKGFPVVVIRVGGLVEVTALYPGVVLVDLVNPDSLARGIERGAELAGRRFSGASSWDDTVRAYSDLFDCVCSNRRLNSPGRPRRRKSVEGRAGRPFYHPQIGGVETHVRSLAHIVHQQGMKQRSSPTKASAKNSSSVSCDQPGSHKKIASPSNFLRPMILRYVK